MATDKVWRYGDNNKVEYKVPPGKGKRCIILHLGSATTGLLTGCLLMIRGKKDNEDAVYHTEMNSELFQNWIEQTVFPALKMRGRKCVVVLDRAFYHTVLTAETRPPRISWKKEQLIDAVIRRGNAPTYWPTDWKNSLRITKALLLDNAS